MADQGDKASPKRHVFISHDAHDEELKAEIGHRLVQAVKAAGGNQIVSAKSGVPLRTLGNLLGGQEMKVSQAIRLAEATGVSVQWLLLGKDPVAADPGAPAGGVDEDLMRDVVEVVEEFLSGRKLYLAASKKWDVYRAFYELAAEGELDNKPKALQNLERLVRLAS